MKINRKKLLRRGLLGLAAALLLAGCRAEPASMKDAVNTVKTDFSQGAPEGYRVSDGWTNGSMFNVTWRGENVTFEGGVMSLTLSRDPAGGSIPYAGGELQSTAFTGYGRYEACFKAIRHEGVVSSFFTYTGPTDNNPWDEIDFEVLGKDPTQVQLNYFTNGVGGHEVLIDLGFDASEDFHQYAFDWQEGRIDWYVDGKPVHTATENIPTTPGKIMANAWCGVGVDEWLAPFDGQGLPLTAQYRWFAYTPAE